MLESEYKIVFEFLKENGTRVGQVGVEIDWEPAREWTRFLGIRRGLLPLGESVRSTAIEPLWNRSTGEPYLQGFRVVVSGENNGNIAEDFPVTYFYHTARQASGHFVATGSLNEMERFQYLVAAYPDRTGSQLNQAPQFESNEVAPEISCDVKPLSELMSGSVPEGVECAGDMPVFLPQQVLDEAESATLSSRGTETGGILIGHLRRDESLPEVFVEITAQIPARAVGGASRLTFNAETWTAVRAAVDIRNKEEIYLGFWHSHPVIEWCRKNDCSLDLLKCCPLAKGFLSADDQAMFRTVFPRAYSVALVCSDLPIGEPSFSLFGWRHGTVECRGFHRFQLERQLPEKSGKA